MAQVPTYGGPQVRTAPLQPPMQREIDVSSGTRALGNALGQVADLTDRAVRRDAESEANRVDSEITGGWLQWDAENRRKYQGQNADQYDVDAKAWWDKARETYGKDLSPLAQGAVGQTLARKKAQALAGVAAHVGAEKERFADQSYDAAQKTDVQYAVTTGDTVGTLGTIKDRAKEYAKRKGLDTAGYEHEVQQRVGTMHLTMIQALAESNPTEAAKYYAEAKKRNEIPATAQPGVEKLLKAEGDNQAAIQFAALHATKPLAEQLRLAGEITDPDRRKKTLTEIHSNATLVKQARIEAQTVAKNEAWGYLNKGARVPEAVWSRMDQEDAGKLREHLADRARIAADRAAGKAAKTDWATYIDLREKLAAGEKVDLRPYAGTKIAPAQLEQLLDIQTKAKDPKKMPEVATSEQQISTYTRQLELKNERLGMFQSAAYDLFNAHLKAKGKEPTYDERQTILDTLTKEIVIKPGVLWDTKGPAYQAPRDVRNAALVPKAAPPAKVASDDDYSKLPSGARFVAPDGTIRIKP